MTGRLIQEIRTAVEEGRLKEPFSPKDVIAAGVWCAAKKLGERGAGRSCAMMGGERLARVGTQTRG